MAQPKNPPLSVRLPADVLAKVDAWAAERELKRNAAIVALLTAALPVPGQVEMAAALGGVKARETSTEYRDGSVARSRTVFYPPEFVATDWLDLPYGPPSSAPGSRLKKKR